MSDSADRAALKLLEDWLADGGQVDHLQDAIATALRAFAEEARREEREALKLWAKGRCGHCQIAAEDFVADQAAAIRARGETVPAPTNLGQPITWAEHKRISEDGP